MVEMIENVDLRALPLAPVNPLPFREQVKALKDLHAGIETLRDAGGPVTRLKLPPKWLTPPVVVVTSPQGIRDVLGRSGTHIDKTIVHHEMRHLLGPNVFDLTYEPWLPRRRALQPIFTKRHVGAFGGHMAQAAEMVAAGWVEGAEIDLDTECRRLALRALGRSVLGIDLDERSDIVVDPMRVAVEYIRDRAVQPVRAPRWLPTPARRRARAASTTLHRVADEIVQACHADPDRDAPLVHALIAATDPETGRSLSDDEICDELIIFMFAGQDTTATLLTYALWALGHHVDIQDKVRAEVTELGNRELTPDDVPRLGYTIQVLHEALRLCSPASTGARMAMQDIAVDGYRVEAGTVVFFGIYAIHRDPALWDRPLVFDPERFSPEGSKSRDRWQYLPFGGGPRSCIGDHFAMLEATLGLATIIRGTEIQSLDAEFPMVVPFTLVAAAPIRARMNARANA